MRRGLALIAAAAALAAAGTVAFIRLQNVELLGSPVEKALAYRIESIPIERICEAIASGRQILGDDHVVVWSDEKRYVVVGWRMEGDRPAFYWTGVDLPQEDIVCRTAR
ncbi:MAG: hypothetical protein GC190_12460 [Alphaproteobacteria bacterium]|nr:hypothetical protein [Alphaproteobacteria bacterium]